MLAQLHGRTDHYSRYGNESFDCPNVNDADCPPIINSEGDVVFNGYDLFDETGVNTAYQSPEAVYSTEMFKKQLLLYLKNYINTNGSKVFLALIN